MLWLGWSFHKVFMYKRGIEIKDDFFPSRAFFHIYFCMLHYLLYHIFQKLSSHFLFFILLLIFFLNLLLINIVLHINWHDVSLLNVLPESSLCTCFFLFPSDISTFLFFTEEQKTCLYTTKMFPKSFYHI